MFITPSFKKSLIVEQFQGNYLTITMNKRQINNNSNDQVLDGYVIKLRLIVELHITHPRLENTAVSTKVVPQKR